MRTVELGRVHRILIAVVVTGAVVIATIGFAGSYAAVRELAERKGFGAFAPFFPIGIDAGIVVLLALDLLLTFIRIPFPLLRQTAWLLTAATIAFNGAAAWPDPLGVGMHAVIPVLFVVTVEAARHAIGRIADITADKHMEGVRVARWLLAFPSTFRLWRRMKLWELRSYDEVIRMEQDRLIYEARLQARFGRNWRRKAPVESMMPLRLARYGLPLAQTGPAGLEAAGLDASLFLPRQSAQEVSAPLPQLEAAADQDTEDSGETGMTVGPAGSQAQDTDPQLEESGLDRGQYFAMYVGYVQRHGAFPTQNQLVELLAEAYGPPSAADEPLDMEALRQRSVWDTSYPASDTAAVAHPAAEPDGDARATHPKTVPQHSQPPDRVLAPTGAPAPLAVQAPSSGSRASGSPKAAELTGGASAGRAAAAGNAVGAMPQTALSGASLPRQPEAPAGAEENVGAPSRMTELVEGALAVARQDQPEPPVPLPADLHVRQILEWLAVEPALTGAEAGRRLKVPARTASRKMGKARAYLQELERAQWPPLLAVSHRP